VISEILKFLQVQGAAVDCDDFQVAVLTNWVEYKKQKRVTEYR
jgi:hypothetical protein